MPMVNLSTNQTQIGLFLAGTLGGLLLGWIIRGRKMKSATLRSLRPASTAAEAAVIRGIQMAKLGAISAAKVAAAERKSSSHADLEWTDTSDGESDEAINTANPRSRSRTKIPPRDCKMVLLVRMDLEMGKGKMAAQCAHAAVGAYEEATQRRDRFLRPWQKYGQAKIALKVPDESTLHALTEQARNAGINAYIVRDAGRTQIAAGSVTVAAVGPAPIEAVDKITGHLKLL